jgi:hypothetical protein
MLAPMGRNCNKGVSIRSGCAGMGAAAASGWDWHGWSRALTRIPLPIALFNSS